MTFAVHVVSHADRNLLQAGEHVELGEHDVGQAVDLGGVPVDDCIEPATATRAAGGHAEFVALLTQPFAGLVQQFGGEWAFAHASDVGLGDADYAGDLGGAHAGTGAGAAGGRVGRGDERVGAVVHVKHGGLSAFEQYGLAFVKRLVENQAGVGHVRLEAFAELQQLLGGLVHVNRTTVVELDQHLVLLV